MKSINGWITICKNCGEQVGNNTMWCKDCRTKEGRANMLQANLDIARENQALGYTIPKELR